MRVQYAESDSRLKTENSQWKHWWSHACEGHPERLWAELTRAPRLKPAGRPRTPEPIKSRRSIVPWETLDPRSDLFSFNFSRYSFFHDEIWSGSRALGYRERPVSSFQARTRHSCGIARTNRSPRTARGWLKIGSHWFLFLSSSSSSSFVRDFFFGRSTTTKRT